MLKKYAVFSGRSTKKEYWLFVLFNLIIAILLGVAEGFFGVFPETDESVLINIYQFFILIPSLAVGIRRMHDVNKSGWYYWIPIYNLILTLRDGTSGDNKYGPDPKLKVENELKKLSVDNQVEQTPSNSQDKPIFCRHCGKSIDADSKFCTSCGKSSNSIY